MRIARVDVFGYGLRYAHGEYVMSGGRSVAALASPLSDVTRTSVLGSAATLRPPDITYSPWA